MSRRSNPLQTILAFVVNLCAVTFVCATFIYSVSPLFG